MQKDVIIVGGGIVGLATALNLLQQDPPLKILVIEKEKELATVERRYQDVSPQTLAAAVVFALTPEDAQLTVEEARQRWAK